MLGLAQDDTDGVDMAEPQTSHGQTPAEKGRRGVPVRARLLQRLLVQASSSLPPGADPPRGVTRGLLPASVAPSDLVAARGAGSGTLLKASCHPRLSSCAWAPGGGRVRRSPPGSWELTQLSPLPRPEPAGSFHPHL